MKDLERILGILGSQGVRGYEEYKRWSRKVKVGLIVNPVAGMGGKIGLKGSDGLKFSEGIKLGAEPVSLKKAEAFLRILKPFEKALQIYSCSGLMGEVCLKKANFSAEIVYEAMEETSAEDTRKAASILKELVELIVFVGGDGTARDVSLAIGTELPAFGVPAGVKMHSSVFALNVRKAAELLMKYVRQSCGFEIREVMDVDEDEFRADKLKIKLFGYLKVPVAGELVQAGKSLHSYEGVDGIALQLKEMIEPDMLCILGPGGTVYEVMRVLGIRKTKLGVDLALNGRIIARDVGEKEIIEALNKFRKACIIVTPIGGQGFIFGRGNQQISSRVIEKVIEKVGKDNIIVIASEAKLKGIRELKIDLDDLSIAEQLRYVNVISGYGKVKKMRIVC